MANIRKREPYDRAKHGEGLRDFMQAFDNDDLSDGAWQAMLEEGGQAFADFASVRISGYDAFMEYVDLSEQGA